MYRHISFGIAVFYCLGDSGCTGIGKWPRNPAIKQSVEFSISQVYLANDFPGGSDGKEHSCNAGDQDSIPRLGRLPEGGHGNQFQHNTDLFDNGTSFSQTGSKAYSLKSSGLSVAQVFPGQEGEKKKRERERRGRCTREIVAHRGRMTQKHKSGRNRMSLVVSNTP